LLVLLDASALIALFVAEHPDHDTIECWLAKREVIFTSCPITEGALVRYMMRNGFETSRVSGTLDEIHASTRHKFWPDDIDYRQVDLSKLMGYRQVTDAYLAELARHHGSKVVTFDAGFAAQHPDNTVLLPS